MKMRHALRVCRLAALAVMAASTLQAEALKNPKRVVNGQTVDLTPLFGWWKARSGPRPLGAWVHVTGPVVGSSVWGWTLDAQIEKRPPDSSDGETNPIVIPPHVRIVLKYPPQQDRADFDNLIAQRQALNNEHNRLSQSAASAAKRATDAAKQYDPTHPWKLWSSAASDNYAAAKSAQGDAEQQLKAVDDQLAEIARKLAAYPDPNHYVVDCFAMETGDRQNGVPVYAHGMVLK